MRWLSAGVASVLSSMVIGACAIPARADFYDLSGRYECLEKPDAVCYDATPDAPPSQPPSETAAEHDMVPAEPGASQAKSDGARPDEPKGKKGAVEKHAPAQPVDPYRQIVRRIQARKPEGGDLSVVQARAKTGDASALDLLAWCTLEGVGVTPNPIRAYILYGEAAAAGAPQARANQEVIYGRILTQEQRQQLLDIQNGRIPPP